MFGDSGHPKDRWLRGSLGDNKLSNEGRLVTTSPMTSVSAWRNTALSAVATQMPLVAAAHGW